jgi:glycosyltransferase involved in cell wall biosynthesis
MIVKNEAHIIAGTLENILQHIPIKYWVISDTGSTDETKEIIRDFFQKKQIPGELVEHEWKDFAYNRTKALECAFQKTDYLFIFDADDSIEGTIQLPPLKEDRYMFRFGKESDRRTLHPALCATTRNEIQRCVRQRGMTSSAVCDSSG